MQSSVENNAHNGMAGQIVDTGPKDIVTRINTSGAVIPFGVFVTKGAAQDGAVLPDATGEVTGVVGLGVTVRTLSQKDADGYAAKAAMSVMKKGRIWVQVEDAVVAESQAYVRFAPGETEGQIGAFRSNASNKNEIQVVDFTGTPAASTWTLTLGEETTAALAHNASTATIKGALEALTAITAVTVTGSYAAGLVIEFTGADAATPFADMTINVSSLTGVTAGAVAETQAGVAAANATQLVEFVGTPSGGTWTLTLDEDETTDIAHNADAAAIKAALEALTAITEVTVTGSYAAGIEIEFTGDDAATPFDEMTVDVASLTGVTDGSVTLIQAGVAAANEIQTASFTGTPAASTWTLTLEEAETAAIAYNANAATIKGALEALTAITTVTVTGTYAAGITIEFTGADANKAFEAMTVDVDALTGVTAAAVTVEQEGCPVESAALPRAKFVTGAAAGQMALLDLSLA